VREGGLIISFDELIISFDELWPMAPGPFTWIAPHAFPPSATWTTGLQTGYWCLDQGCHLRLHDVHLGIHFAEHGIGRGEHLLSLGFDCSRLKRRAAGRLGTRAGWPKREQQDLPAVAPGTLRAKPPRSWRYLLRIADERHIGAADFPQLS
jgi:hypothetical protein